MRVKMSKKFLKVNWKIVTGSARSKKVLRLRADYEGIFACPVENCMHTGFKSNRGLRKHIDARHDWYYYFDVQPTIKREDVQKDEESMSLKCSTHNVPSFSITEGVGLDFVKWLKEPLGGGKNGREANQIGKRGMKFLIHAIGGDMITGGICSLEYLDACLGSPEAVINFMQAVTGEWGMKSSGALNYVKAMSDLVDFRKSHGVSAHVLQSFAVTEVYLRRGKENLRKKKAIEYSRNLDLETLIGKDSWATLEELEKVVPFHAPKFQEIYESTKNEMTLPNLNDLAFASRFIVTFLFLRVKCSRPMTFQYMTLDMVEQAKVSGFIDATQFKTSTTYIFDTVIMTKEVLRVLDMYITRIRPLMNPSCDYVIVSNSGKQYNSFTTAMTLLVKAAIGKYVHATRFRQIVETESASRLTPEEQKIISQDQKHSSQVAARSYQKRLSRDVAMRGKECMEKMLGESRTASTGRLSQILQTTEHCINEIDETVIDLTKRILSADVSTDNPSPSASSVSSDELSSSSTGKYSTSEPEVSQVPEMERCSDENTTHATLPSWPAGSQDVIDVKVEESTERRCKRRKKKFTKEEDQNLLKGLLKHGKGHWHKFLKDSSLKFDPCRDKDSLRMRYNSAQFKLLLSREEDLKK
jgi:hypothetical protein